MPPLATEHDASPQRCSCCRRASTTNMRTQAIVQTGSIAYISTASCHHLKPLSPSSNKQEPPHHHTTTQTHYHSFTASTHAPQISSPLTPKLVMDRQNMNRADSAPRTPNVLHRRTSQAYPTPNEQGGSVPGLLGRLRQRLFPAAAHPANRRHGVVIQPLPENFGFADIPRRSRAAATRGVVADDEDEDWAPGPGIMRPDGANTLSVHHPQVPRFTVPVAQSSPYDHSQDAIVPHVCAKLYCDCRVLAADDSLALPPLPIPTLHGPEVAKHYSNWCCCRCGHYDLNYPLVVLCFKCGHQRCNICRPQLHALGPSRADMMLSRRDTQEFGGAVHEPTVAEQVAISNMNLRH
ncbi:hypothetical protein B0T11DRAFT_283927 [Plectosphaerella cucumerina]|uniref:Uncharacterized protein n=1 Tax=Plectosphaerella cucumerina TaxID=40658 RepID=A0A8K0TDL4_9PEZI|nr:hypothetical protein B0T11DRAFT_283927 [Plectosphaerella cucumerina]